MARNRAVQIGDHKWIALAKLEGVKRPFWKVLALTDKEKNKLKKGKLTKAIEFFDRDAYEIIPMPEWAARTYWPHDKFTFQKTD